MKPYKWVTHEGMLKSGFTLDGEKDESGDENKPAQDAPDPDEDT